MSLHAERARLLLRHPAGWLATGFGSGLSPFAPGTVGSLVAIAPWLVLRDGPWWWAALTIVVVFAVGVRVSDWVIRRLGTEDPGCIVIDEWVGQWLALGMLDAFVRVHAPFVPLAAVVAIAFVAFRICDIAKPWPVRWADRNLHGGVGTMLDDALAGVLGGALAIAAVAIFAYFR